MGQGVPRGGEGGQNESLWEELVGTAGTVLVEASPHDTIWGIGLTADDPDAQHKATWRGKNWLGYALTEVSDVDEGQGADRGNIVTDGVHMHYVDLLTKCQVCQMLDASNVNTCDRRFLL